MKKLFRLLKELHARAHQYFIVEAHVGCALSNYGEQFASKTLRRFFIKAITPAITNADYEGDIKKKGNKVSILSFLDDVTLTDYAVGTDMNVQNPEDTENQLTITEKKYYNFDIDEVDKEFTYVEDEDSNLIENAGKVLEKTIDTFVLKKVVDVKAGHRVGTDYVLVGDGTSTSATINTSGALTLSKAAAHAGLVSGMIGKGIRINSTGAEAAYLTTWYRIATVTSTIAGTVTLWNGKSLNSLPAHLGGTGSGCTVEAAYATTVTKSNVYAFICDLQTKLDDDEIPDTDRHLTVPPWFKNLLVQASELQPDIAMYHEETIVNGKVGRVGGFEVHMAPSERVYSTTGLDSISGYCILANHTGFITFAHKWSESRVINAEKQFARLYQGLNLYGAEVTTERRRAGAYLFAKQ